MFTPTLISRILVLISVQNVPGYNFTGQWLTGRHWLVEAIYSISSLEIWLGKTIFWKMNCTVIDIDNVVDTIELFFFKAPSFERGLYSICAVHPPPP